MKKYNTPSAFRNALEQRLVQYAKEENIGVPRLRKQVAFDRLLVRLFSLDPCPWVLKGGYAMQLRTPNARVTKDVDLAMREENLVSKGSAKRNKAISDLLYEQANLDMNDFFTFIITGSTVELEGVPEGGVRFHIEAVLDGRTFEKFLLDIGVGDVWIEPLDMLKSGDWLKFMGIESKAFPAIPKEQQFAEKLHAYTRVRGEGRLNSRVKDLVDMILLIDTREMKTDKLTTVLKATFENYDSHELTTTLMPPPPAWSATFQIMTTECELKDVTLDSAFVIVQDFIKKLPL